jgi:uncharacterized membrane protein
MSSGTGNWLIASGVLFSLLALIILSAGLHKQADANQIIVLGACVLSMGLLLAAGGTYVKTRALQSSYPSPEANHKARVRGGCDLCAGDAPVIQCKVHQLHLCPACLAEHYDFRSCAYVPSTRGRAPRTARTPGKARSAAAVRV